MTQADEQKLIDYEVAKFKNRLRKLNQKLKIIQVKDIKVGISEPKKPAVLPWLLRVFSKKG